MSVSPKTLTRPSWGPRLYLLALTVTWFVVAGLTLADGLDYYRLSLHDRAYAEDHAIYKPAGRIGHTYGVIGSMMMTLGVIIYAVRKRSRRMARLGKLRYWLQFHIFLCTLGPYLILLHTTFRFGGLVSISFWSMAVVVLSGVFGRYVYARIPKTLNGQFLTPSMMAQQQHTHMEAVRYLTNLPPPAIQTLFDEAVQPPRGFLHAITRSLRYDLTRRRRHRHLTGLLAQMNVDPAHHAPVAAEVEAHHELTHRAALVKPFQQLFGYWHVFHIPLAVVMFIIMILHIAVAIAFGYGWSG